VPQPYVQVQARRYRLRILNLSVMRPYNLTLSGGGTLTQIGNESGLLPAPHQAAEYLIGPAQRLDVIADFSGLEGKEVILTSVDDTSSTSLATAPAALPASGGILQFRIGPASGADTTRIPRSLRALPDWVAQLPADHVDRVWAFGLAANDDTAQATTDQTGTAWTINGRTFDPTRIDAKPEVGTTETWALINTTPYKMSHFIHIHDVDSYVISRNGQPPTGDETGLKETFTLNPGDVVIVGLKFSDFTGPYMIHCHMLGHEDHGMMSTFAVVPPGQGDLPPTASGRNTHARLNGRRFTIPLHGQTPFSARMVQQVLRQVSHRPGCPADPRKAYRALHARVPAPVSSAPASPFYCKLG
jgi:FtsP/CotA-like multicopper oxidase with cupredoxin domain